MTCPALDLWIAGGVGAAIGAFGALVLAALGWANEMDGKAQELHRARFKDKP